MFESSLVASQRSHASAEQRWTALASITVQVGLAAVVIAVPLFHQEMPKLKIDAPKAFVELKPPPKLRPVQVTATRAAAASAAPRMAMPVAQTVALEAPPAIPILINTTPDDAPPRIFGAGSGPGMTTGLPTGVVPEGAGTTRVVAAAPRSEKPAVVSSGVTAGLLMAPIRPVYPAIARSTRTEGTVVVEAIISKAGRIESLNVVSEPALLRAAAMEAIREARYRPYLLNGAPVEVQTTITVNFRMEG